MNYIFSKRIFIIGALFLASLIPFLAFAAVTGTAEFGQGGTGDGEFNFDYTGIAIDSSGNIYVADGGNNRIQKFDSSGTFLTKWGTLGTGDGELTNPDDVAIDSNGDVWVLDDTRVQKFSNTGTFIASYDGVSQGGSAFTSSTQLAIDSSDNIYVGGYQLVQVFDSSFTFIESFDGDDKGGSTFNTLYGLELDASDNLYTNGGGGIQKFDSNYDFVTSWSGGGGGLGVTPDGTVYTSQSTDTQIKKFTTDGTFIESFSCFGSGITCVSGPSDIDFYGTTVYVAEQGPGYSSDRINIFGDTGLEDTTAPTVDIFSPADDATSVELDTAFSVTFNENVYEPAIFIEFAFGLYKASDDSVVFELTNASPYLSVADNVLSVPSLVELESGTEYYIQIAGDYLDDDADNFYAGISDTTTWSFTTLTQPYVVSADPVNGATGVSNEPTFTLTFSEAMDTGSSLMLSTTPCNFGETGLDCATPSIVGWSEGDTVVTIQNGNGAYAYDTEYTMTIGQGIDADEGADLAEPYEWVFTIESAPTSSSRSSSTSASRSKAKKVFDDYYDKKEDNSDEDMPSSEDTTNEENVTTEGSEEGVQDTVIDTSNLQAVIANGGLLRRGSKGDAVEILQQLLNQFGAQPQLVVDGDFGRLTYEAVEAYQQANGLTVDGIVGKNTLELLLK